MDTPTIVIIVVLVVLSTVVSLVYAHRKYPLKTTERILEYLLKTVAKTPGTP